VAEFVSLADVLRPRETAAASTDAGSPVVEPIGEFDEAEIETVVVERTPVEPAGALRDARLFRARLGDAFDDARSRLLRELAADVLARELRIAPCDLDLLARRVLAAAPVVRIRVAPCDVGAIGGVPIVADAELSAGDAVVELAGGTLDARLGVRLAQVLEAFE
jgi:hypothetical protein